nr:MAG TPA: hypothetical protein [Bacteriophage sp.]
MIYKLLLHIPPLFGEYMGQFSHIRILDSHRV